MVTRPFVENDRGVIARFTTAAALRQSGKTCLTLKCTVAFIVSGIRHHSLCDPLDHGMCSDACVHPCVHLQCVCGSRNVSFYNDLF